MGTTWTKEKFDAATFEDLIQYAVEYWEDFHSYDTLLDVLKHDIDEGNFVVARHIIDGIDCNGTILSPVIADFYVYDRTMDTLDPVRAITGKDDLLPLFQEREFPFKYTKIHIPNTEYEVDLAAVESVILTSTYEVYEGGIDSDGHERKDNFSTRERALSLTYKGKGIAETKLWDGEIGYPVGGSFNLFDLNERHALLGALQSFTSCARQGDYLDVIIRPRKE